MAKLDILWVPDPILKTKCAPGTGIDVFQPVFAERHGHPVLCRCSLVRRFLELPVGGTARDVIRSCPRGYVLTSNPGVVEDMDTPEDYARELRKLGESTE